MRRDGRWVAVLGCGHHAPTPSRGMPPLVGQWVSCPVAGCRRQERVTAVRPVPRLLDAYCCEGGGGTGYHRAGFDVTGIDIQPQPLYPFEFIQGDALKLLADRDFLAQFDAIHASPPCQKFTQMSARWRGKGGRTDQHEDLLTPTRPLLKASGLPYVIENVVGARRHMEGPFLLHGGMFDLGVHRPRLFESNVFILLPKAPQTRDPVGVYGERPDGRRLWTRQNGNMTGKRSIIRAAKSVEEARELMGMPWADWHGCKEAIPPAYTEFIGNQLIEYVAAERAA